MFPIFCSVYLLGEWNILLTDANLVGEGRSMITIMHGYNVSQKIIFSVVDKLLELCATQREFNGPTAFDGALQTP